MTQQIINNGESGLIVRGKLNDNFTELYTAVANPYPQVTNFAALPDPTTVTGAIYIVQTTTGIIGFRKLAGLWRSDGVSWNYLGLYGLNAAEIVNVPAGRISATNVQIALSQLDTLIALGGAVTVNLPTGRGVMEWTETFAASGVTPASRIALILAGADDTLEYHPDFVDLVSIAGLPGTDTITASLVFSSPYSGPLNMNWSAQ